MTPRVWLGEGVRWYLKHARHPFKGYIVGHYWAAFSAPRWWVRYEGGSIGVTIGDYLQQRIFFDGHYEAVLVAWLKKTLRQDDVFWDVGANIGAVTLVAARLCRRVVAFEPDPRSLLALRQNIEVNRLDNVEIVTSALGGDAGTATLYQAAGGNTGMTSLLPARGEVVGATEVQVVKADDVIAAHPDWRPTVVKLDVEGAEHLVLGGATDTLRSGCVRALIFEDQRDAATRPTNAEVVARLNESRYRIEPLGVSDALVTDGMLNFLATPLG